MRRFKSTAAKLLATLALLIPTAMMVGCTDPIYEVGSNLNPDGDQVELGYLDIQGAAEDGTQYYSTRLYISEDFNFSNQLYAAFGARRTTRFGDRLSGFYSQYTPAYEVDEDEEFGYDAIVDSVMLYFTIAGYSGDTTSVIRYGVYEVKDDAFITESADTVYTFAEVTELFEDGFTGTTTTNPLLSDEPLFTFDFPDAANQIYLNATGVKMVDVATNDYGETLLARWMLEEVEGYEQITYEIYDEDYMDDWLEHFKGIYVRPVPMEEQPFIIDNVDEGATYLIDFEAAGIGFYGRSKYEDNPAFIKDTIGMTYVFRDTYYTDYGGVSVNANRYDYASAGIDIQSALDNKSDVDIVLVEGMGGLVTEIQMEQALFERFAEIIDAANYDEDGNYIMGAITPYTNLYLNSARLMLHIEEATGYGQFSPSSVLDVTALDNLPTRLGLYSSYTNYVDDDGYTELTPIEDYDYYSESTYSIMSNYDGYLNRTLGCYVMNIPIQLQMIWNYYCTALDNNDGVISEEKWEGYTWNKLYVGPVVDDLFTVQYATTQGQSDLNAARMRLDLSYTLLKE